MSYKEIQGKIKNILMSTNVGDAVRENETLLFDLIPELKFEKGFEQRNQWHCYDVWEHTIHAIISSEIDFNVRLVLLLHDIGKPFSYQEDGCIRHFRGHAEKSAQISEMVLKRLGYSDEAIEEYCFFIRNHATTITEEKLNNSNIEKYKKLLHIQYCDASAYAPYYAKQIAYKLDKIKLLLENQRL